jgi:hypothetical protein
MDSMTTVSITTLEGKAIATLEEKAIIIGPAIILDEKAIVIGPATTGLTGHLPASAERGF